MSNTVKNISTLQSTNPEAISGRKSEVNNAVDRLGGQAVSSLVRSFADGINIDEKLKVVKDISINGIPETIAESLSSENNKSITGSVKDYQANKAKVTKELEKYFTIEQINKMFKSSEEAYGMTQLEGYLGDIQDRSRTIADKGSKEDSAAWKRARTAQKVLLGDELNRDIVKQDFDGDSALYKQAIKAKQEIQQELPFLKTNEVGSALLNKAILSSLSGSDPTFGFKGLTDKSGNKLDRAGAIQRIMTTYNRLASVANADNDGRAVNFGSKENTALAEYLAKMTKNKVAKKVSNPEGGYMYE